MYNLNSNTTGLQLARKASYMAVKYGLTLDTTYFNTSNAVVWEPTYEPSYHHSVIGIASEASENLQQKQSHTTDDSLRIFISSLAADNASNTGTFISDKAYLMIGNNQGALYATPAVENEKPPGIYSRIEREWKVHNTNWGNTTKTSATFNFEIKLDILAGPLMISNLQDLRLLVSATPDMTNAVVYAPGDEGVSFGLGSVIINNITTYVPTLPGMGINGFGGAVPKDSVRFITLASANGTTPLTIVGLLPLDFISLNASAINNSSIAINWQTVKESRYKMFSVERSLNGSDWEQAGQVNGHPNSLQAKSYSMTDITPYNGRSYYRLKLFGTDGQYTYTTMRTVRIEKVNGIDVYPNPATSQLTLKEGAAELTGIRLFNMMGKDVTNLVKTIEKSNTTLVLDVSRLVNGIYNIKTAAGNIKVLKQ